MVLLILNAGCICISRLSRVVDGTANAECGVYISRLFVMVDGAADAEYGVYIFGSSRTVSGDGGSNWADWSESSRLLIPGSVEKERTCVSKSFWTNSGESLMVGSSCKTLVPSVLEKQKGY